MPSQKSTHRDKAAMSDSLGVRVEVPEGEEDLIVTEGLNETTEAAGEPDGPAYTVESEDRGWFVREVDSPNHVTVEDQTFFETEDEARIAATKVAELKNGTVR